MVDKQFNQSQIIQNQLIDAVSKHLSEQTEADSPELDRALKHARMAALDKAENRDSGFMRLFSSAFKPLPMSAFAGTSLLVLVFLGFNQTQMLHNELHDSINELAELEILMSDDNLELYEDLEFYEWLVFEEMHSS